MTEKYTPEKVAELVAEAREGLHSVHERDLIRHLADALTAVSAELEHLKHFDWLKQSKRVEGERDRLHKAITEALGWRDEAYHGAFGKDEFAQGYGYARRAIGRILRAALDKEGSDDE